MSMKALSVLIVAALVCSAISEPVDYTNRADWGDICNGDGNQSPIDINIKSLTFSELCPDSTDSYISFQCEEFVLEANQEEESAPAVDKSFVYLLEEDNVYGFSLQSMNYHIPAEHTFDGLISDLQFQLVYDPISGTFNPSEYFPQNTNAAQAETNPYNHAVVSVLFKVDHQATVDIFDALKLDGDGQYTVNLEEMVGCLSGRYFYQYEGSLTEPACTLNVQWLVSREILPVTMQHYQLLQSKLYNGVSNARPLQDLNGRSIKILGDACEEVA